MRIDLLAAVGSTGGVITRMEALAVAPIHVLDDAVKAGLLVRVLPSVYALPTELDHRETWQLAVAKYRPEGALSHLDALALWGLPVPDLLPPDRGGPPIHLTTGPGRMASAAIIRHQRRQDFVGRSRFVNPAYPGLVIVGQAEAMVGSWPLLNPMERPAPIIVGLRDRHVSVSALRAELARWPNTPGAAEMRQMVELVAAGNHSELELWGHAHVFSDPALPASSPQHPVRLHGRKVFLDRYFQGELLDVELDGAAYHGRPGQRERDLRRDAALAALGIQVVRFSHPRLHADPRGVVDELVQILRVRRRQFGLAD